MKAIVVVFVLLILAASHSAQADAPALSHPDLAGATEALGRFPPIENRGNLLYLDSPGHINAALNYLEALREQAGVDAANLESEGQLPNYVDPLIGYEASLGLKSLRARIESELANASLEGDFDLNNSAIFKYTPIGALRSLLNDYEEIAVGGKYHRIKKDATLSYETLEELINSRPRTDDEDYTLRPDEVLEEDFHISAQTQDPNARAMQSLPLFPVVLVGCKNNTSTGNCLTFGSYELCWGLYHQNILGILYTGAWTEGYKLTPTRTPYLAVQYASVYGQVSADHYHDTICLFYQNTCRSSVSYNLSFSCRKMVYGFRAEHRVKVFQSTMPGWTKGRHYFYTPYIPATAPGAPLSTVL